MEDNVKPGPQSSGDSHPPGLPPPPVAAVPVDPGPSVREARLASWRGIGSGVFLVLGWLCLIVQLLGIIGLWTNPPASYVSFLHYLDRNEIPQAVGCLIGRNIFVLAAVACAVLGWAFSLGRRGKWLFAGALVCLGLSVAAELFPRTPRS